ncbi:hypothetical protein SAMN05444166_2067 [Singulisphaera sp. GP187]|uniref:hypothetical protein n=1 Tax=Singulisphaera sp. GP187 TaxID=1882752 RepID=UPI00092A6EBA|nr:hypothetical protein [Singulisphaera sp. GP187]SIO02028.1 hypothetical protein SAMN05444166_2067 [Singulisphaera sp. GP187]
MLWRHLCLARAWSAAGLSTCLIFAGSAFAEPEEPSPAAGTVTETVRVLDARQAGDIELEVRGQGQDRVRFAIRNTSAKRLNVVLPPGLVAASATGQRGGGGGGFQSMGLGTPTNQPGGFGQFRGAVGSDAGLHSIPVAPTDAQTSTVTVPAGKTIDLTLPAVCLNFGMPTPTGRDRFELMDVNEYTGDARVRKALRSLATLGTSQGVAQAAMWRVCNDVPFELMRAQASKVINGHEVALAARFVEAIDASGESDVIEPSYLAESRLFIRVQGEGELATEAARLQEALQGLHLMGLPLCVVSDNEEPTAAVPALFLNVTLTSSQAGETRGRVLVSRSSQREGWLPLGKTSFTEGSTVTVLDGPGLARALDHAMAATFVSVKVARKGANSTTLKVENRLPFTLANVTIKAGGSSGSPAAPYRALGIGPARTGQVSIQAASGTIDRIELNGL